MSIIKGLTLTHEQFNWALKESGIHELGRNFLFRVVVTGEQVPVVAKELGLVSTSHQLIRQFRTSLNNEMNKNNVQALITFKPL